MSMPSCRFNFTLDRETAAGHAKSHVQLPLAMSESSAVPSAMPDPSAMPYACNGYSLCMPCVFGGYSICVLCAFHVNAMCTHGHVHAMGSHVYSM